MHDRKMVVRVELKDKDIPRFKELQEKLGIQIRAEVLRFAVKFTLEHYEE